MSNDYTKAVILCLNAGQSPKEVFAGLERVLARRGHASLLPRIMRTLSRELERDTTLTAPTLTVADAKDAHSDLVKTLCAELGYDEAKPEVQVDETIIGGAKLRVGATEIDATYKTALINLYQAITK